MALWPPDQAVVWRGHGLVLREWTGDDADSMVRLFDTEEMNRWTPLVSPFDRDVALQYVEQARRSRRQLGTLQLAVTEDGAAPLGEVLIFPATAGIRTARLTIATDNVRSQRVAVAAGFALTGAPLTQRRRKGFVLTMAVWERAL
jgi:RimJ/RimL family protein N-acetyltransferase